MISTRQDVTASIALNNSTSAFFYSLPMLERAMGISVQKLPVSIRIVLESLLRNLDGDRVTVEDVERLAKWQPSAERSHEIPFVVSRVLLQDFTGVPLGVDLAAMRAAMVALNKDPAKIEPLVPVDLVVDHSVQVDFSSRKDAFALNLELEFKRNEPRYRFLKWCTEAFKSFRVVPPGIGICHQVNLEYLAPGVTVRSGEIFPDTLVGTDSHTTMINGLGVVGWGVGGIEAEAAMLGQPVYFLTPDVVGLHLRNALPQGATATDLVLRVTELLRSAKVVGKFVEFFGEGAASLAVPDRATLSNMAPEYGATMGFFPVDERTCDYLLATGRSKESVDDLRSYFSAQGMFGMPRSGDIEYSSVLELDLSTIEPSIAGPRRPQDRIGLSAAKAAFGKLFIAPAESGGYGKNGSELNQEFATGAAGSSASLRPLIGSLAQDEPLATTPIHHGDIVIAAITSCTNTSNPSVMLAAGLVAKKAIERGMSLAPTVKASLAPGSRVVTEYLTTTGLQQYLDELGFNLVGYGCTTCIGNSGPLHPAIEKAIQDNNLVVASVLSGNRNFEARVHQSVRANFLMSPPLVVAYAIAGTVNKDLTTEVIGNDRDGNPVYLKDIWPTQDEINSLLHAALLPDTYKNLYANTRGGNEDWNRIAAPTGITYQWEEDSTYIQHPPYFDGFLPTPPPIAPIEKARVLAIFGDSVTTDHISPAGAIKAKSPAGLFLSHHGVAVEDFNSYGSRRGNHEIMVRGTFANVRIRNLMVPGIEGGVTLHQPSGDQLTIYDAAIKYLADQVPLVIFAGTEYGTGSSRDWAAKGTRLLGVRAVIAKSFERIHRSNLIGMGVLPCQFLDDTSASELGIKGDEEITIYGIDDNTLTPRAHLTVEATSPRGSIKFKVLARLDTAIEVSYLKNGGILPYVLRAIS